MRWALETDPESTWRAASSLLTRVTIVNVAVLVAACVALIVTPATVSDPVALEELVFLVGGVAALVVANLFLLRRAFAPLRRLTDMMGRVDHLRPGLRIPEYGGGEEIVELTRAFNDMLDRLEAERRSGWQRAADAQESERRSVARELHDEVGQSLTALKLLLARARRSGGDKDEALEEAAIIAEQTLGDVREIARRLRPEALDELGCVTRSPPSPNASGRMAASTSPPGLNPSCPRSTETPSSLSTGLRRRASPTCYGTRTDEGSRFARRARRPGPTRRFR